MPGVSPARPALPRAGRKARMRDMLRKREFTAVVAWALESRETERLLNSCLFDVEDIVRWRALQAIGRLAAAKARTGLSAPRETVRRMLWAMNDESGNNVFHAPELIGEVLANVPGLIPEFVVNLAAFSEDETYRRGVHWALARAAAVAPSIFAACSALLRRSLSDEDPSVRGSTILALGPEGAAELRPVLERLRGDNAVVELYDPDRGEFRRSSIGELACAALALQADRLNQKQAD
jgi:HEAT repeat protein